MNRPVIQILLVEDSQTDAFLLKEALSRDVFNLFELTISVRLVEALDLLCKSKFDLILLDLGLPDSQGMETFQKIHQMAPGLPVIVLSGLMDERLSLDAIQAGAQDYLVKGPASWEIAPRAIRYAIERKRAEESLRASEAKYRKLFDEMSNGSALHQILCDESGNPVDYVTLDVNAAYESLLGIKREQVIGSKASETLPPKELQAWLAIFGPTALTGTSTHYEIYSPLNERYFAGVAFSPEPGKFAVTFSDVTERKRAEETLQESEERFRTLIEQASEGIALVGEAGNVLEWNQAMERITGFSLAQAAQLNIWDIQLQLLPSELRSSRSAESIKAQFINALQTGNLPNHGKRFEGEIETPGGERKIVAQTIFSIKSMSSYRLGSIVLDITERKRMEEALQESEERFRSLYNNATIGLYRTTPDGRILMCNPAAVRLLGFESFDELAKRNLEEDGFEPDYPRREFRERMEREGTVIGLESRWTRKDGTSIIVKESATAVRESRGNILYYDGTFEDITEHKRAEEAIRQSEKKFKTLFEIAPVGIAVLDPEQNIIDVNYSLQRITGLKKHELLVGASRKRTYLRPDGTVMPLEEYASTRALKEEMPIFDIETGVVTEDRGVVWTQVSAAPLNMPDASLVVVTQDISERKLSEETVRQRLAELETLYESGLSLSHLLEPHQIGQKIIDVLEEKLDWYHTTIRLYHPESDSLELLAYNLAQKTTQEEWQRMGEIFRTVIARPGDGLSGWVMLHGETVRSGNLLFDPRYVETVPGIRSGLYVPIKTGERTIGVISIESEKPDFFSAEDEHLAVTLAAQAAIALENIRLIKDLRNSNNDLFRAYDETIEGWSHALDLRDKETEGHTQRVTTLTEELAREMGIPDSELIYIRWGALLHDIGKMGVPDRILLKPDKLSDDEWVIMREHSAHAYNLLSRIEYLRTALNIPHYHHEKWDGSGYPDGLHREQIPLEARIFAVVDVFDALTSDRPYRPAWPKDTAIGYIREQSGMSFDPQVVGAFMKLISRK